MTVSVPIKNPFHKLEGYNCFGCAPDNKLGLHMTFRIEGDEVLSDWQPENHLQGWVGVLHGGIQATLMDEIAGWFVLVKLQTAGVTSQMEVKFLKPVKMDLAPFRLRARLQEMKRHIALIRVELYMSDGTLGAEALMHYHTYPEHIAREKLYYPGIEHFFPVTDPDKV
ncbi:MAG: PaaI family thioesterase [Lentimicrobiaceae bacterium]|jgi:acyl-coenzyme A thioesterase PaaI-like protein